MQRDELQQMLMEFETVWHSDSSDSAVESDDTVPRRCCNVCGSSKIATKFMWTCLCQVCQSRVELYVATSDGKGKQCEMCGDFKFKTLGCTSQMHRLRNSFVAPCVVCRRSMPMESDFRILQWARKYNYQLCTTCSFLFLEYMHYVLVYEPETRHDDPAAHPLGLLSNFPFPSLYQSDEWCQGSIV